MARPRDNREVEIEMSRENADNNRLSRKFRTPPNSGTEAPPPVWSRGRVGSA